MKRVITYGTFDLLHYGHINLLRRARALGDYLIVALSTDEFNQKQKAKQSYFDYKTRELMLDAIRYVDLVIPEETWEQKPDDIKLYKVDIFVMGDDWEGRFDYLSEFCEVAYLPKTPEISSTMIRNDNLNTTAFESLKNSLSNSMDKQT
ncbi:MAG: glycerol-3-phosphate cytidylyltransferase [Holophagales bacterium]|jgi:glycerol-3-phosphate cytidylyltransferase|nr:glycerol-3-phosphate cytidylyltransferase [Holophagales bacterium]